MNITFYGGDDNNFQDNFLKDFNTYYPELEDTIELFGSKEKKHSIKGRYPKHEDIVPKEFNEEYKEAKELYESPLQPFERLDQIKQDLPYQSTKLNFFQKAMKKTCHNGQRKLFMCELQHLTHCLDSTTEEALVIYAGAAAGNHSPMLGSMYPNVKFIFVDPNEFNMYYGKFHNSHYTRPGMETIYMEISASNKNMYKLDEGKKMVSHYSSPDKPFDVMEYINSGTLPDTISNYLRDNSNIGYKKEEFINFILESNYQYYLIENYFTDELAELIGELISKLSYKIIFWSDIRTALITDGDPLDEDIIINTYWMISWIKKMIKGNEDKQFYSMLKFRPPFGEQKNFDIDLVRKLINNNYSINKDTPFKFFKGKVYMQCWHPIDSAETRLWCELEDLKDDLIEYPLKPHEEKCFVYNMVYRYGLSYENTLSSLVEGFDHCGDCALEAKIWNDYAKKYYNKLPDNLLKQKLKKLIVGIGELTGRPLNRFPHGKFE